MSNETLESTRSTESTIIGCLYGILSIAFIIAYMGCAYILATNKNLGSPSYHMIVLQITVADILQLIFNGLISFCFLLCPQLAQIHWLNKLFGSVASSAFFLYGISANLLGFNRFIHILWNSMAGKIFSPHLTKCYLLSIWVYCVCWFFLTTFHPRIQFFFYLDVYSWDYCETPECHVAATMDLVVDSTNVICMIIWYTCIYVKIKTKLDLIRQTIEQVNETRRDTRILLQAFLLCLMVFLVIFSFFVVPIFSTNRWVYIMANFIWIISSGINSVIYLTLNETMRNHFFTLYGCQKKTIVESVYTMKSTRKGVKAITVS